MELKISVAQRFTSAFVKHDLSALELVAFAGKELVEIKVEEVFLR
jgi:hypothetical protein